MAHRFESASTPGAISGSLSGAGNLQVVLPVHHMESISFLETWDGTLAGTPQIWVSNNYASPRGGGTAALAAAEAAARWTLVTDASITAFLAAAPPTGGKPNGAPGDAALVMPVTFAAVRWRLTWSAGAGNYTLDAEVR